MKKIINDENNIIKSPTFLGSIIIIFFSILTSTIANDYLLIEGIRVLLFFIFCMSSLE